MEPIYPEREACVWDYDQLQTALQRLLFRKYKIIGLGVSAEGKVYRDTELRHIEESVDILHRIFMKRWGYIPVFAPL